MAWLGLALVFLLVLVGVPLRWALALGVGLYLFAFGVAFRLVRVLWPLLAILAILGLLLHLRERNLRRRR